MTCRSEAKSQYQGQCQQGQCSKVSVKPKVLQACCPADGLLVLATGILICHPLRFRSAKSALVQRVHRLQVQARTPTASSLLCLPYCRLRDCVNHAHEVGKLREVRQRLQIVACKIVYGWPPPNCRHSADKTPHHGLRRPSTARHWVGPEPWTAQHNRTRATTVSHAFLRFPKPGVAGSIPAEGASFGLQIGVFRDLDRGHSA